MGNSRKNLLVWNQFLNQNQTLMEQLLDGPLPKLCPAVALSRQDGRHSAVALLLKAALLQVSNYRLLDASGFKSSPLKLLGQMNLNLVGSIYGNSSVMIAHFVLIHYQTWPPQTILVFDWLISKKSSPLKPLCQMNRSLVGSIYGRFSIKIAHFLPIHLTNMDTTGNSCF